MPDGAARACEYYAGDPSTLPRLPNIRVHGFEKVWEPRGLKYPRRGHETNCARSLKRAQFSQSVRQAGRQAAQPRSSGVTPTLPPRCRTRYQGFSLISTSDDQLQPVCVQCERLRSAMLTTCLLVEKLSAVQHRGGSGAEQRALLQVGCASTDHLQLSCTVPTAPLSLLPLPRRCHTAPALKAFAFFS